MSINSINSEWINRGEYSSLWQVCLVQFFCLIPSTFSSVMNPVSLKFAFTNIRLIRNPRLKPCVQRLRGEYSPLNQLRRLKELKCQSPDSVAEWISGANMAVQQKILRRNRTGSKDISYKRWSLQFPGTYQWFEKPGSTDFSNGLSQFDRNDVLAYFPATARHRTSASLTDLSKAAAANPLVRWG